MKRPVVSLPSNRVALAEVMEIRALRAGILVELIDEVLKLEKVTLKEGVDIEDCLFVFEDDALNALNALGGAVVVRHIC